MKAPIFISAIFFIVGSISCLGQTRTIDKPIQTNTVGAEVLKHVEEKTTQVFFICKLPVRNYPTSSYFYLSKRSNALIYQPRRDFSNLVLFSGVETRENKFSIKGSRSEPLVFVDGVKTRGSANLPTAAIMDVIVISGGIPANLGDSNAGIIQIFSMPTLR